MTIKRKIELVFERFLVIFTVFDLFRDKLFSATILFGNFFFCFWFLVMNIVTNGRQWALGMPSSSTPNSSSKAGLYVRHSKVVGPSNHNDRNFQISSKIYWAFKRYSNTSVFHFRWKESDYWCIETFFTYSVKPRRF